MSQNAAISFLNLQTSWRSIKPKNDTSKREMVPRRRRKENKDGQSQLRIDSLFVPYKNIQAEEANNEEEANYEDKADDEIDDSNDHDDDEDNEDDDGEMRIM